MKRMELDKGKILVTLETSGDEELDHNIRIDVSSEGGYLDCCCIISLKNLLYSIKDIIPYEWISDMKEDKRNETF